MMRHWNFTSTLLWTLPLLLLSNAGWSLWASTRPIMLPGTDVRRNESLLAGHGDAILMHRYKYALETMTLCRAKPIDGHRLAVLDAAPRWLAEEEERAQLDYTGECFMIIRREFGWPAPLLWYAMHWHGDFTGLVPGTGVPREDPDMLAQSFPLRLIWTGQLASLTILFFIALGCRWVLSWARGSIRRLRRLCSACGYNLHGNTSGVCPECGVPWLAMRAS